MLSVDPAALESLETLLFGIAAAGLIATGFEAMTARRASFQLLTLGGPQAVASVPLIVFSAPFIILRNTVRGRRFERRRVSFVALATVIACLWGLACGRVLMEVVALLTA